MPRCLAGANRYGAVCADVLTANHRGLPIHGLNLVRQQCGYRRASVHSLCLHPRDNLPALVVARWKVMAGRPLTAPNPKSGEKTPPRAALRISQGRKSFSDEFHRLSRAMGPGSQLRSSSAVRWRGPSCPARFGYKAAR